MQSQDKFKRKYNIYTSYYW